MLNSETKRHIDAARDVLVGVAPNPTTQIDQITYALIYKFMDDMDQAAVKAGGEPTFFTGELNKYAWSKLVSTTMGNQEKMNLYGEALTKFSEAKQLPELFRTIFKAAFLPYRSPETLGLFLKEISYFDYSHSEELGNAYEYLLSIMSSQGDAGQFRTPRHIIDFMVDVVNPTKTDKVLDPACGTGGFLVSSYNHILEQHDGKDDPKGLGKTLTPDERKKLMQNFEGYDIDPTMVRIAQVNMYLHLFKNPKIFQYDTLTSEERWNDKFDVVMANPPFMSPKGGIKPHNKFGIQSNRSEVLFVDYISSHLRPKGRAAIIVPEGIIFQSGKAYKELRKNLIGNGLYAVVSLPSGVFQPYSGVKTSILFLNGEIAKEKSEILFLKINADGFDLGATKKPVAKNDLPDALKAIHLWEKDKKVENPLFSFVSKEEIASNGDYSLTGDRYNLASHNSDASWPLFKLGDLCDIGSSKRVFESDWKTEGVPFYRAREIVKLSKRGSVENELYISEEMFFDYSTKYGKPIEGDLMVTGVGTLGICYQVKANDRFYFKDGNIIWLKNFTENVNSSYLKHLFSSRFIIEQIQATSQGGTVGTYTITNAKETLFPLPPLEVQEQIVDELDGYSAIISGAKQVVENWKPAIELKATWQILKLGDVANWASGGTPKSGTAEYYGGHIPWVVIGDLNEDSVITTEDSITQAGLEVSSAKIQPKGTVMLAMYGASIGKTGIMGIPMATNQAIACGTCKPEIMNEMFLLYYLQSQKNLFVKAGVGGAQPNISQGIVKDWPIPVPPMIEQEEILEVIAVEKSHVESAKKLIQTYENRSQALIAKLWKE